MGRGADADARSTRRESSLTGICGRSTSPASLAFGGVFAELMTGNLLLMGITIGAMPGLARGRGLT